MTAQHRADDDHRPGPGCWIAMATAALLVFVCMGVWQLWGGR